MNKRSMKFRKYFIGLAFLTLFVCSLSGCQTTPNVNHKASNLSSDINSNTAENNRNSAANANQNEKTTSHEHTAPHGGTLIAFGEEFAHLELVINAENGEIAAYALDGEAEKSVPLAQETIEIEIEKPQKFKIKLEAVENSLTGEKRGATSEFRANAAQIKDLKEFDAKIKSITIRGREFKNVHFHFPEGNEKGHQH